MYAESHQGPHATLALGSIKGQTSAEEAGPHNRRMLGAAPGPGLSGKAGTLRAPW